MADFVAPTLGEELDNEQLCELFGCGPQGGMRRSHKTNTLTLISNHVESIYDDRWIDGVLHYTGMGQTGHQSLSFMQNKTLAESPVNGVAIHLFEVHQPQTYTYVGEVSLSGVPYQEVQNDVRGDQRNVWVFPLATKSGIVPPIPARTVEALEERKTRFARRMTDQEIQHKAKLSGRSVVGSQTTITTRYQRSVWVAEHAKRRANGLCELCRTPAPFSDKGGLPYLETHHIQWLARGGADTIENTVALCPNCHKKMHVLDLQQDILRLRESASGREVA
ncbi:HNH endonuclease [Caenibius sp. WL]|uniref:HNH endonuclease n=1 Tax=Caenibius sp. WL TaxID=2872646 RepID=UPI001C990620|nr:HNH endonuclease [Caenibius sp. WL]QZP07697.1 HNH endonuclease [Caenibius sp. WL]